MSKAQGTFGLIFSLFFFIVVWFVWLGGWLNTVGQYMITSNNLSGIEALICANLNIVVLFAIFIGFIGFTYAKQ